MAIPRARACSQFDSFIRFEFLNNEVLQTQMIEVTLESIENNNFTLGDPTCFCITKSVGGMDPLDFAGAVYGY